MLEDNSINEPDLSDEEFQSHGKKNLKEDLINVNTNFTVNKKQIV